MGRLMETFLIIYKWDDLSGEQQSGCFVIKNSLEDKGQILSRCNQAGFVVLDKILARKEGFWTEYGNNKIAYAEVDV